MAYNLFLTLIGLIFLVSGGEALVRGVSTLALRLGLSILLVSMVVAGFGTSLPEMLVSIKAALNGAPDIALGNVVGSNIANIFLILGISAAIYPLASGGKSVKRDSIAVIFASALLCALAYTHTINHIAGAAMLMALCGYLVWCYRAEQTQPADAMARIINDDKAPPMHNLTKAVVYTIIGLFSLMIGANFLVTGATAIARSFGISEAVIGLTLVAVGTSLPELATSIIAARKKQSDILIGNVLGSNLFNILAILGTTSLIIPLPVTGRIGQIDIWVVLFSAVILYVVMKSGKKISRLEGVIFLVFYALYIASMFVIPA